MNVIKILSIDQSTQISGYAIFDDGKIISHGYIDLHKFKDSDIRFEKMCTLLMKIIHGNSPDMVVIEDVVLQRSPNTMKILSRLQGIIIGFCMANKIEIRIMYPTRWRKILGFKQGRVKREELKKQAKDLVKRTYDIDTNDDEADAICIGCAFMKDIEMEDSNV